MRECGIMQSKAARWISTAIFALCIVGIACFLGVAGCASCVEFLMDTTECLDFQHMSKETRGLFSKDRTGMSKAELLAEIAEVEYAKQLREGYADCLRIPVMFPSNVAESVALNTNSSFCSYICSYKYEVDFAMRKMREHSHDVRSVSNAGKWESRHDGFEVRVFAREWHLSDRDDFFEFIYPQASQVNTYAVLAKKGEHDVESTCLRESCCWGIYPRKQEGVNLAVMGCVWYDMLIVEFDEAGIVVRQRQISWGVGDG